MKTEVDSPPASRVAHPASRSGFASFLRYWVPVLLWMSLVFGFSTEAGATRHTSRIIGPLLRWFNPSVSDETIRGVQLVLRKTAHLTEYAVLAVLLWRARRQPVRGASQPWRASDAVFALALTVLFAASDEWHQSFVPSREGRMIDVLIDSCGAVLGLFAWWAWGRWRRNW